MSTIITNVAVVTMNETREVIQHGFAAWKGGEITAVGTMDMLEQIYAIPPHETKESDLDDSATVAIPQRGADHLGREH